MIFFLFLHTGNFISLNSETAILPLVGVDPERVASEDHEANL
jgi:hypothetical protein